MTRAGQPSILSFFHKQPQQQQQSQAPPKYAAPLSHSHPPLEARPAPPNPPPAPQPTPLAQSVIPPLSSLPTILSSHPSATIVPVTEAHIPALRRINALLLPVNYTDAFYRAILDPAVSGLFSRSILWQQAPTDAPKVIGGLICRLEPSPFHPTTEVYDPSLAKSSAKSVAPPRVGQGHALYIQSLVLLAPYRGLGLVTATLEGISEAVAQVTRESGGKGLRIDWVYAHVWTENEEGLAWYGRRGFERDGVLERYYWKLQPDSAWVLKKRVGLDDKGKTGSSSKAEDAQEGVAEVPASVTAAAVNLPGFGTTTTTPPPTTTGPPNPRASRPPAQPSGLSFQNKRPDMEWNDLPEDMVSSSKNSSRSDLLAPPTSSSRSSSTGRKKKDRAYPTAAFGN
ncbi:hypothetical protein N0V93_009396 [Gnomoniopsis smithogilvyi]|uniref:N-acetyltransferase domain-containing protein n=1 Tax=Gnomoniopsis smithogilvyi TaxID=1191159 RepID=A0A9W8YKP3_9PEZI|nr:hypothetical protein N0V93_009396 [Gnomoniopsis smithogilvyi]